MEKTHNKPQVLVNGFLKSLWAGKEDKTMRNLVFLDLRLAHNSPLSIRVEHFKYSIDDVKISKALDFRMEIRAQV